MHRSKVLHTTHYTIQMSQFISFFITQRDKHTLTYAHTHTHIETRTVQFACFFFSLINAFGYTYFTVLMLVEIKYHCA